MVVGERIRAERVKMGWSQEELARRAYVSRPTVSHWETGKSLTDAQSLLILSRLFQMGIDELVKGDMDEMGRLVTAESRVARGRILVLACVTAAAASALLVVGLVDRPLVGGVAQFCFACLCVAMAWVIFSRGCDRALRAKSAADVLTRLRESGAECDCLEDPDDRIVRDRLLDEIARDGVVDPHARFVLSVASAVAIASALAWVATLVAPELFM